MAASGVKDCLGSYSLSSKFRPSGVLQVSKVNSCDLSGSPDVIVSEKFWEFRSDLYLTRNLIVILWPRFRNFEQSTSRSLHFAKFRLARGWWGRLFSVGSPSNAIPGRRIEAATSAGMGKSGQETRKNTA